MNTTSTSSTTSPGAIPGSIPYIEKNFEANFYVSIIESFFLVLFCELGDKSFIMLIILQLKTNRITIISGALFTLLIMNFLVLLIGKWLDYLLYKNLVDHICILVFFVYGLFLLGNAFNSTKLTFEEELVSAEKFHRKSTILRNNATVSNNYLRMEGNDNTVEMPVVKKVSVLKPALSTIPEFSREESTTENFQLFNKMKDSEGENSLKKSSNKEGDDGYILLNDKIKNKSNSKTKNKNSANKNEDGAEEDNDNFILTKRPSDVTLRHQKTKKERKSLIPVIEDEEENLERQDTIIKDKQNEPINIDNEDANEDDNNENDVNDDDNLECTDTINNKKISLDEDKDDKDNNANNADTNLNYNNSDNKNALIVQESTDDNIKNNDILYFEDDINANHNIETAIFWMIVKTMAISECGDRTQFIPLFMSAVYNFQGVLIGTSLALITSCTLGVYFGKVLIKYLHEKVLDFILGLIIINSAVQIFLQKKYMINII